MEFKLADPKSFYLTPPEDEKYGFPFQTKFPSFDQGFRELYIYSLLRGDWGKYRCKKLGYDLKKYGFLSPTQHMINAMGLMMPGSINFEVRGILNTYSLKLIDVLCRNSDIAVSGNAACGKTWVIAAWALMDWISAPWCTSCFVATTSKESNEYRIWGAIKHFLPLLRYSGTGIPIEGDLAELLQSDNKIVYLDKRFGKKRRDESNCIKGFVMEKGQEGQRVITGMKGRHNERVLSILDELAEMESKVNDIRGNQSNNIHSVYIGIANPSAGKNPHKELCQPKNGWDSVTMDMDTWETRTGIALRLTGLKSPNFDAPDDDPPYPKYLTRQREQQILKICYGDKNHIEYWKNVIGWWPPEDTLHSVIPQSIIEAADTTHEPKWSSQDRVVIAAFDPAFSIGGDRSTCTFGRLGQDEYNRVVAYYMGTKIYHAKVGDIFEQSIAKKLVEDLVKFGVEPKNFGIDISGDGGKMLQAIIKEWLPKNSTAVDIQAISSSDSPSSRIVSEYDPRKACDVYDRRVSELWFNVYQGFQTRVIYGVNVKNDRDKELLDELCARLPATRGKKIAVEKKEEMRLRMGRSPDIADSFVYFIEMCRMAGLIFRNQKPRDILSEEEIDFYNRMIRREDFEEEKETLCYSGSSTDEDGF